MSLGSLNRPFAWRNDEFMDGDLPVWWEWELELSPHLLKRMMDRRFTEVDLRAMLEVAEDYHSDDVEGRWVIQTRHHRKPWEVVVEPDLREKLLVVVTAYPLTRDAR